MTGKFTLTVKITTLVACLSFQIDYIISRCTSQANRILSSAMVARSGLEVLCTLIEFYRKIKASLQRQDLNNFKTTLRNFSFANLEFSENVEISPPNVMNAIRTVDKIQPLTMQIYTTLCECVHPNWSGLSVVDDSKNVNENPVTARLFLAIVNSINLLKFVFDATLDFDLFMVQNAKNYKAMLLKK